MAKKPKMHQTPAARPSKSASASDYILAAREVAGRTPGCELIRDILDAVHEVLIVNNGSLEDFQKEVGEMPKVHGITTRCSVCGSDHVLNVAEENYPSCSEEVLTGDVGGIEATLHICPCGGVVAIAVNNDAGEFWFRPDERAI